MATKDKKSGRINFDTSANVVTPIGASFFTKWNEPGMSGKYEASVIISKQDKNKATFAKFEGVTYKKETAIGFDDLLKKVMEAAKKELDAIGQKYTVVSPWKKQKDRDKNETGEVYIQGKKDPEYGLPQIMDASAKEIKLNKPIGNDSKLKLSLYVKPYFMKGELGLSFKLNAIQIIDLKEGTTDVGFEAEEGYEVEESEFEDNESTTTTTDSDEDDDY